MAGVRATYQMATVLDVVMIGTVIGVVPGCRVAEGGEGWLGLARVQVGVAGRPTRGARS